MLKEFLKKIGVNGYEELTEAEKQTFLQYQQVLTKEVTVEDIKKLVNGQIEVLTSQFTAYDNPAQKDLYIKARLRDMLMLKALLDSPDKARENLKNIINNYESKE